MITLIHAGDFHLDSPFRSLPAQEAARRRQEQRQTLEALRDLALERRADLVLLSGDLFDTQQVYPETLEILRRVLGQLPCPVCISPGNHDYWSDRSPYASQPWPENVHIFQEETMTAFPLPALGVTVYGCAFTAPDRDDDPLAGFAAPAEGLAIGLIHADVGGTRYAPIDPASIAGSGLAYLALGHVHQFGGLRQSDKTFWAYPGCLQGRGFDETGDKGVLAVELDGERVSAQLVPLPGSRYLAQSLDLTGQEPAPALAAVLARGFLNDYLRLTFTGEAEPLDLPALRALGEPLCRSLELRDDTQPPQDVWAKAGEDTLTGLFLQEMRRRLEDAPEEDKATLHLALRFGLAALEGREEPA